MKTELEKVSQVNGSLEHLPISHFLRRYNIESWICFGLLTHKYPTKLETQVEHFRTLMDTLGGPNHCFGKRLHWFLRAEGGNGPNDKLRHLHFILGGHKVTDGHYRQFYIIEVCDFLNANWSHGMSFVQPYQPDEDGVGYVTKIQKSADRDDYYEVSHALKKHLLEEVVA